MTSKEIATPQSGTTIFDKEALLYRKHLSNSYVSQSQKQVDAFAKSMTSKEIATPQTATSVFDNNALVYRKHLNNSCVSQTQQQADASAINNFDADNISIDKFFSTDDLFNSNLSDVLPKSMESLNYGISQVKRGGSIGTYMCVPKVFLSFVFLVHLLK